MTHGKVYNEAKKAVPAEAVDFQAAAAWLKAHARKNFNETVELHIHLGVDPSKSEQSVRGSVVLPAGSPKQKKVLVFASSQSEQHAAQEAGAAIVGGEELINKIAADGGIEADITVATPEMMPKIAKVARILGPKGLMPNPKSGTVTPNPAAVIKELAAGKLNFKMDSLGNIHEAIGKCDWEADRLVANGKALLEAVRAARPAAAKGELIRSVTMTSTMGSGIKIAR